MVYRDTVVHNRVYINYIYIYILEGIKRLHIYICMYTYNKDIGKGWYTEVTKGVCVCVLVRTLCHYMKPCMHYIINVHLSLDISTSKFYMMCTNTNILYTNIICTYIQGI